MYDLTAFTLRDMTACGAALRRLGDGAGSMEEVGGRIARFLYGSLRAGTDPAPACALVRFFVTLAYADLEPELRQFACGVLGRDPERSSMKCLTLLGTAGDLPAWNSRATSVGHKALPLPSEESIARSPMIAQLIIQFGLPIGSLLAPAADVILDSEQHTYNVFHVPDAVGSAFIPAQEEFVLPYGIRSVLGFGGLLPSANLFATILFSKHPITRETADMFRALALNVKVAILPFAGGQVFA
jgi:hypothetical protein